MSKSAADVVSAKRQDNYVVFGEPLACSIAIDGNAQYGKDLEKGRRIVADPPLRPDPTTPKYLLEQLSQ